jgi:hypothetical protein
MVLNEKVYERKCITLAAIFSAINMGAQYYVAKALINFDTMFGAKFYSIG